MKKLTEEQAHAITSINTWLSGDASFFTLSGYAGTGKTFLLQKLLEGNKSPVVFCAPTNKATRVLREVLTKPDYKPLCRTIYSLLGLKLEANGEVKELTEPEDPVDLTEYRFVVVDEASMIGQKLMIHIKEAAEEQGVRFLFLGDPAQLPPVGEAESPVWHESEPANRASLTQIVRHGGPILELVTKVRKASTRPAPSVDLPLMAQYYKEHLDWEGVERLSPRLFLEAINAAALKDVFTGKDGAKAVAWTNACVDKLNGIIRGAIFDSDFSLPKWVETDRVIFTAPAADVEKQLLACTDDEGTVMSVRETYHPLYGDFKVFDISITLDSGSAVNALVLHPESEAKAEGHSQRLAIEAKVNRKKWRDFWEFKESFHSLRHGYALTAHRAQGSTFDHAFVDTMDILKNRDRRESFQCLYVACSRARKRLTMT